MFNTLPANPYPPSSEQMGAGGGGSYVLPTASADTLGGVKVGNNLSINENGALSAPAPLIKGDYIKISQNVISVDKNKYGDVIYKFIDESSSECDVEKWVGSVKVQTYQCYMSSAPFNIDGKFTLSRNPDNIFWWLVTNLVASKEHPIGWTKTWDAGTSQPDWQETFVTPIENDTLLTKADLSAVVPSVPSSNGAYVLTATRTSGGVAYTWESTT